MAKHSNLLLSFTSCCLLAACSNAQTQKKSPAQAFTKDSTAQTIAYDSSSNTIHVLVALCDNKNQGIVPVPAKIGNGQDPANNLYWGCSMGVRSYFQKSAHWTFVKAYTLQSPKLERIVFKHKQKNYYLIADAYDGQYIQQCTVDFFRSCAGQQKDTLKLGKQVLGINGHAKLLAYIGHDGLMEFQLREAFTNVDGLQRKAIMLACISKSYFAPHLKSTQADPLVWSTGLMSPEAYTLHDALEAYLNGSDRQTIRIAAAKAYHHYQKCGEKAAKNLLVSGY
jgi:hypothetical protein